MWRRAINLNGFCHPELVTAAAVGKFGFATIKKDIGIKLGLKKRILSDKNRLLERKIISDANINIIRNINFLCSPPPPMKGTV